MDKNPPVVFGRLAVEKSFNELAILALKLDNEKVRWNVVSRIYDRSIILLFSVTLNLNECWGFGALAKHPPGQSAHG